MKIKDSLMVAMAVLSALLPVVLIAGCTGSGPGSEKKVLLAYVAAAMKGPMEEITAEFTGETGIEVQIIHNGSGALLSQLKLAGEGDLYMAGEGSFMERAVAEGLISRWQVIAYREPVIVVPRGNPAGIRELADLARPGVEVILADESVAIGKTAGDILKGADLLEEVTAHVIARVNSAPQVALSVGLGEADAGITGKESFIYLQDKVDLIAIAQEDNISITVPAGILEFSRHPQEAEEFLEFIYSRREAFNRYGFR